MEPCPQSKSRKRALDVQEDATPSNTCSTQDSQQRDRSPESKRFHPANGSAFRHGLESQSSDFSLPNCHHSPAGHSYGPSTVSGNGSVQNGDFYYTAGSGSQVWGPSIVNGEMIVHLSNAFHTYNYGLFNLNNQDAQEQELKSLLYYSSMDNRKAQLKTVDPATFQWIWTQTAFPKWLVSDDGMFWISGKPASGKSTLIHYLSARNRFSEVVQCLECSGRKWILMRFYFDFRAGTKIANNMLGMLRSLLLQLIEESTAIKNIVLKRCGHRLQGTWPELEAELLELICEAIQLSGLSVCCFIDGLDEYSGSLSKLINLLLIVQKQTSIKICLASRPEPELVHRLRGLPTLAMQDYNQGTIKTYIEGAIADTGQYALLEQLCAVLEEEVIAQANGVILWAIFAVDEAVKAALHGCTSTEIRDLVRSFPQELTTIYERILDNISPSDQRLAATILFVVQHWESSFYGFIPDLTLSSAHLTSCCKMILRKLDPSLRFDADYNEFRFRLKTYATLGGLVEFVGRNHEARLVHKSVQSFLGQSDKYSQQVIGISRVVDMRLLGPRFLADAMIEICDDLLPHLNSPKKLLVDVDQAMNLLAKEFWGSPAGVSTDGRQLVLFRNWFGRDIFLKYISETINSTLARVWHSGQFHGKLRQAHNAVLIAPVYEACSLQSHSLRPRITTRIQPFLIEVPINFKHTGPVKKALRYARTKSDVANSGRPEPFHSIPDQPRQTHLSSYEFDPAFRLVVRQPKGLNRPLEWETIIRTLFKFSINPSAAKHSSPVWRDYIDLLQDDPDSLRQGFPRAAILQAWGIYARRSRLGYYEAHK